MAQIGRILKKVCKNFHYFSRKILLFLGHFANTRRDAPGLKKIIKNFLKKVKFFWKKCWQRFFHCDRMCMLTPQEKPNEIVRWSTKVLWQLHILKI